MGADDDLGAGERLVRLGLVPQRHDAGHLLLGDLDLAPPVRRLLDAAHAKVRRALRVDLLPLARRNRLLVRAAP